MTRAPFALAVLALAIVLPVNAFALSASGPRAAHGDEATPATLPSVPAGEPPVTLPVVPTEPRVVRPHGQPAMPPQEGTAREPRQAVSDDTMDAVVVDPALAVQGGDAPGMMSVGFAGPRAGAGPTGTPASPGHEAEAGTLDPIRALPPPVPLPSILPVPRLDLA
jgi:hypothetical protein